MPPHNRKPHQRHATPGHAMPCHARPCHAMPWHGMPRGCISGLDVKGDPSHLIGVVRLVRGHRLGGGVGRRRWGDDVARGSISVDL